MYPNVEDNFNLTNIYYKVAEEKKEKELMDQQRQSEIEAKKLATQQRLDEIKAEKEAKKLATQQRLDEIKAEKEAKKLAAQQRLDEIKAEKEAKTKEKMRAKELNRLAREGDGSSDDLTCKSFGAKPSTEPYINCRSRLAAKTMPGDMPQKQQIPPQQQTTINIGDGTQDDTSCQKYGFVPGTFEYSQCRLQLDTFRKQAQLQEEDYLRKKEEYDYQLAANQKEKEREKAMRLFQYGLGLMSGQTPQNALRGVYGLPPEMPRPPALQNYSITTPRGVTNCTYSSNTRTMHCN
jgi:hypothetical protein